MPISHWLWSRSPSSRPGRTKLLGLESLEDRTTPASFDMFPPGLLVAAASPGNGPPAWVFAHFIEKAGHSSTADPAWIVRLAPDPADPASNSSTGSTPPDVPNPVTGVDWGKVTPAPDGGYKLPPVFDSVEDGKEYHIPFPVTPPPIHPHGLFSVLGRASGSGSSSRFGVAQSGTEVVRCEGTVVYTGTEAEARDGALVGAPTQPVRPPSSGSDEKGWEDDGDPEAPSDDKGAVLPPQESTATDPPSAVLQPVGGDPFVLAPSFAAVPRPAEERSPGTASALDPVPLPAALLQSLTGPPAEVVARSDASPAVPDDPDGEPTPLPATSVDADRPEGEPIALLPTADLALAGGLAAAVAVGRRVLAWLRPAVRAPRG